ncbi:MAG TPA: helix-turn-helix domain-containing protein [Acidobacteria bacterium]|nr:helix-turn-helix domain-containing protein [Acidobacteriota bacterium]
MSSEDNAQLGTPTDVGARLRAAREAKQISLREIAATTKISVSALEALEENDVAQLPGGIFTRAFVRSYATEVGLDPEEVMRDFVAQVPVEGIDEEEKYDSQSREHDLFQSQQRMAATVLKLVAISAAVLLLYLGWAVTTGTDAPEAPVAETAPALLAPVAGSVRTEPPVTAEPMSQESLTIVLRPRGDCWVSLTIDGELVFEDLMHAGDRESYAAADEMRLIVGDAGAFGFTINQQDGRSLGGSGVTVTARITRQNFRSYLAP